MEYTRKVIMVLDKVQLSILKTEPPTLAISATGIVPSPLYERGYLSPYVYVMPPADGIYDFDFLAVAPTNGITILPIGVVGAQYFWRDFPKGLKGVRIHGSTNNVVAMLDQADLTDVDVFREVTKGLSAVQG